jgi:hypothetical protein
LIGGGLFLLAKATTEDTHDVPIHDVPIWEWKPSEFERNVINCVRAMPI